MKRNAEGNFNRYFNRKRADHWHPALAQLYNTVPADGKDVACRNTYNIRDMVLGFCGPRVLHLISRACSFCGFVFPV
jgi:hypothetical protein